MTKHHIGEFPGTSLLLQLAARATCGFGYDRNASYMPRHAKCWRCDGTGLVGSTSEYGHIFAPCPDGCPPVYAVSPFNKLPAGSIPPGSPAGEGVPAGLAPADRQGRDNNNAAT